MDIASDPWFSNWTHVSNLPPSWGTLYELTTVDDDDKEQIVAEAKERGEAITRADVKKHKARKRMAGLADARPLPADGDILIPWMID